MGTKRPLFGTSSDPEYTDVDVRKRKRRNKEEMEKNISTRKDEEYKIKENS